MTAKVFVTLKKAVLDPQGKAVQRSLGKLGFPEARDVRVGRYIEVQMEAASKEEASKRVPPPGAPACRWAAGRAAGGARGGPQEPGGRRGA